MSDEEAVLTAEEQAAIDAVDVSIGADLQEEQPFLGVIIADELQPSKFKKGPQWHLAVRPVDFALKGKTGAFHEYYGISTQLRSKMGACLAGMKAVGVSKDTKIGRGQLVGFVCHWVKRDMKFGRGSDGQPIIAEGVLVPFKKADDDERARADHPPAQAAEVPAPEKPAWSDDEVRAVLGVIVGLSPKEFQKSVLKSPLATGLKNAVLSGEALNYLLNNGLAVLDADGRVREPEAD